MLLEALNSLGKHVAIVVTNEGRSPEGLRARPILSVVLAQLGGASPISDNLTQAKMDNGGTISLFATSSDVGTSDGNVSRFHLQELLLCILDALPLDRRTFQSITVPQRTRTANTLGVSHTGVVLPQPARERPRQAQIPVLAILLGWFGATTIALSLITA
jgi:hypothetical protein